MAKKDRKDLDQMVAEYKKKRDKDPRYKYLLERLNRDNTIKSRRDFIAWLDDAGLIGFDDEDPGITISQLIAALESARKTIGRDAEVFLSKDPEGNEYRALYELQVVKRPGFAIIWPGGR
jgi:hypothetical protein